MKDCCCNPEDGHCECFIEGYRPPADQVPELVDADGLDVIEALVADATAVEGVANVHEGGDSFAERVIRRAVEQGTLIVIGPKNHPAHNAALQAVPAEMGDLLLHGTLSMTKRQVIVDFADRDRAEAFFEALERVAQTSGEE